MNSAVHQTLAARQAKAETAWLNLTRQRVSAARMTCVCDPNVHGARWSGYLGASYALDRVLFVGSNHNGTDSGLKRTPEMMAYNRHLSAWAISPPSKKGDDELLRDMRVTYMASWKKWLRVWEIINCIRENALIADDGFAFINLALCPEPRIKDDDVIPVCQESFPLLELVENIDAQIIFIAKGTKVGEAAEASVTDGKRWIRRYSNAWSGLYKGKPYNVWIPRDASEIIKAIAARR